MKKYLSLLVLYYLRLFAKLKLSQIKPTVIGVTGSAGKSSCVAAIEAILKEKYKVKTTGTTNSESGIPLAILDLKLTDYSLLDWLRVMFLAPFSETEKYDILVAEMGVDGLEPPKNMDYLLSIIRPKIGVFLNTLPVHTMQMGTTENIFNEKSKLIKSLPADGTAIVNDRLSDIPTKAKVIKFKDDGTPLPPAMAVGKIFGLTKAPKFTLPPGRWSIFKGINGSTLIDSSYNASPVPMTNALRQLAAYKSRKIAVLGDMRELGDLAEKYHKELAKAAKDSADYVISVGPLWEKYGRADKHFNTASETGKFLQEFLKKGDVVLFKGSQNTIFLETAVEMCLTDKSDAALLCRRGQYWDKQRNAAKN